MAEAFAAVGLAGSIVAFVDFAQNFVSRLNQFSNDLKDGANALSTIRTQLPVIIDGLKRIRDRMASETVDDRTKAALMPIVQACHAQVELLSGILDRLLPASDTSKWGRRKNAIRSLTTDAKVKKASEILSQHLQILTFYHSIGGPRPESIVKKVFWLVPFDRDPNFVGRDHILTEIDEPLHMPGTRQPKAALYGLGGIGKSQIALEYCFRRRDRQPTCSVFWVNASTTTCFEESFQRMAREVGLNDEEFGPNESLKAVKIWLETELVAPWVMVIDNVDDEMAFFLAKCHNDKTPSQLIPRCPHGQILFTSRSRHLALDLASPASPILVDLMAIEEGLALLRKRLGPQPLNAHLVELLTQLGHNPLAITQAISFILYRRKSVEQYLELYRMVETSTSRLLSHQSLQPGRQDQRAGSVSRTWQISFGWIQENHPKAAKMLCVIAFYQHNDIPERVLQSKFVDYLEFEDRIAVLRALSLLQVKNPENIYSTHRLFQVATRLWLEQSDPAQLEKRALQALQRVAKSFPKHEEYQDHQYWESCQSLLPHADLLLGQSFNILKKESNILKAALLVRTGHYIRYSASDPEDVKRRYKSSVDLRRMHLGSDHPKTWSSLKTYFRFLTFPGIIYPPVMGTHELAEMGHALLRHEREVFGPHHPKTIESMIDLGQFLCKEGKFEDSEKIHRVALVLNKQVRGQNDLGTLKCLIRLVGVLYRMKRLEEVLELSRESIRIQTEVFGPEDPTVLQSKSTLTIWLEESGRPDEAILMSREVMALREKVLGPDHPQTVKSARHLARSLLTGRRYSEALDILDYVLKMVQASQRVYRWPLTAQGIVELRSKVERKWRLTQASAEAQKMPGVAG